MNQKKITSFAGFAVVFQTCTITSEIFVVVDGHANALILARERATRIKFFR
jgi:hypothetical protein